MTASAKSQECMKKLKVDNYEETDWISSLPDGVLSNILSLMPTKYAFRTSLLSTRWKSLWASATTIDLEWYPVGVEKDAYSDFMDFVDRVLLLHNDPNLNRFRLRYLGYCKPYRLNSWIGAATKLNVQELDLDLILGFVYVLPRSLFTSINLVILKIRGDVSLRYPMVVVLPSLKVLHLHTLATLDEDSLKNVLSGCPILEELDIKRDQRGGIETLFICSSTLKKLDLSLVSSSVINEHELYGVVIKAPALEILRMKENVTKPFHFDELPSLVKAELDVSVPEGSSYKDDHFKLVDGILAKIPNVEQLRLSGHTLQVILQASAYVFFNNLNNLQIDICHAIQWANFPELLGHMPNLKVLILIKAKRMHLNCFWQTSQNRPECLSLCLEKIIFRGFEASKVELKLLRYLLGNAMVLKHLSLTSFSRNEQVKKQILKFPRGSSTCEIELLEENCLLAPRRSGF
ncbi:hypothetical protein Vadar_003315 [Vaccinium darrowii]|uniref:Uncharacterized protein n=1 Tax=Vaccinium darrowii TaxID=229202 RepID=A0ACB7XN70_9ERIC|nr:hypothetical protein Vadar_003315 [Vaccinium darrowii]